MEYPLSVTIEKLFSSETLVSLYDINQCDESEYRNPKLEFVLSFFSATCVVDNFTLNVIADLHKRICN
jgi:hypothetical protein